jgi:hypothetical protein
MAASSEAFKSFKSIGVVVFANSKGEQGSLPNGAREMLSKPEAGNTIPIVMVTTADGAKGLEVIPYKVLSDDCRGAARDLRKQLEGADVVGAAGGAGADDESTASDDAKPAAGSNLLCDEREWTNSSGQKVRAAVVRLTPTAVTFKLAGGKVVDYPLSKLSSESQDELRELADK